VQVRAKFATARAAPAGGSWSARAQCLFYFHLLVTGQGRSSRQNKDKFITSSFI